MNREQNECELSAMIQRGVSRPLQLYSTKDVVILNLYKLTSFLISQTSSLEPVYQSWGEQFLHHFLKIKSFFVIVEHLTIREQRINAVFRMRMRWVASEIRILFGAGHCNQVELRIASF